MSGQTVGDQRENLRSWQESTKRARLRVRLSPPLAFATAVLFLAGTIHICAILLVPQLARSDGWSRLAAFAGQDQFAEMTPARSGAGVAGLDPLFVNGACRLALVENPAAITLEARDRFWSLALYDRQGTITFSLNDRTAADGQLNMLVVNQAQRTAIQRTPLPDLNQTIVVDSTSDDLIALLRLYAPTATARTEARRILAGAECLPAPIEGPTAGSAG